MTPPLTDREPDITGRLREALTSSLNVTCIHGDPVIDGLDDMPFLIVELAERGLAVVELPKPRELNSEPSELREQVARIISELDKYGHTTADECTNAADRVLALVADEVKRLTWMLEMAAAEHSGVVKERDALQAKLDALTADEVCYQVGQYMLTECVHGQNGGWPGYAKRVLTYALAAARASVETKAQEQG